MPLQFLKCGLPFLLVSLSFSPTVRGDLLETCTNCDGSKYALTYFLDSDNGTTSKFDVTLVADTSGNVLGTIAAPVHMDAVAIGISAGTLLSAMEFAPNGAANWTPQAGGLNASGCNGKGSFICAAANSSSYAVTAPNASTATTPYEWTFELLIPDSTPGGAASVFSSGADVKIHYDDAQGHLVSDLFPFTDAPPPSEDSPVPEPTSILLLGSALTFAGRLLRRPAANRP